MEADLHAITNSIRLSQDRRRSPMMTQVPSFSDAGPSSVDSVHPSLPRPQRLPFREGIMAGGGMSLSSVPLLFNLIFVL